MALVQFQIGKQGLTPGFIASLENCFKNHKIVKIYVLKSGRPEGKEGKPRVEKYAKKIIEKLGKNYTAKVIGFTINLRKWRKPA
ncbi:MAG: YhbY family RNA-binding protein, partial [archaeon]